MCVKSFKCKISMALMVEVVNNVKIMKALKGKLLQILEFLQVSYDENIVVIINIDSSNHLQKKGRLWCSLKASKTSNDLTLKN